MYIINIKIHSILWRQKMKSKVMKLANRLVAKMDGDRSAAMKSAWAIVKAGTMELAVKGTSFRNRQEALKRLSKYTPETMQAVLLPDHENKVDRNAVVIMVSVNNSKYYRLGYAPKELTPVLSAGRDIIQFRSLKVVGGNFSNYGVRVSLAV
jgi:hypothetical protein